MVAAAAAATGLLVRNGIRRVRLPPGQQPLQRPIHGHGMSGQTDLGDAWRRWRLRRRLAQFASAPGVSAGHHGSSHHDELSTVTEGAMGRLGGDGGGGGSGSEASWGYVSLGQPLPVRC